MNSLTLRLFVALMLVATVAIGMVAFLAQGAAQQEISTYSTRSALLAAQRVRNLLQGYYRQHGNWAGVEALFSSLGTTGDTRWVLTDGEGKVLAASESDMVGKTVNEKDYGLALPLLVRGRQVGVLHVVPAASQLSSMQEMMGRLGRSPLPDSWPGRMMPPGSLRGRGPPPAETPVPMPSAETLERDFLQSVRNSLWLAGIGAAAVALVLSLVFAWQVTRPLRQLQKAARRIAQGDLSQRVPANSRDEIGELAHSFNAMAESLARNEELRRHMVADIAHELRTPLTVIQGSLEAMLDGVTAPSRERLASLHQETLLLGRLIQDLRDLSLAEAGQLKLERTPTDLAALLARVVDKAQPQAQAKQIELSLKVKESLPPVSADLHRLEQVVSNLLSNALRYTPPQGSIVVTVEKVGPANSPAAQVSVSDTGPGIPAEHLPHVFERFYRADPSRSRATGGSGIGLAVVKQLVELHGGKVWAESAPGQGSRFSFSLLLSA